jgi:hypothetical protein
MLYGDFDLLIRRIDSVGGLVQPFSGGLSRTMQSLVRGPAGLVQGLFGGVASLFQGTTRRTVVARFDGHGFAGCAIVALDGDFFLLNCGPLLVAAGKHYRTKPDQAEPQQAFA